jgi:hypothetical protein
MEIVECGVFIFVVVGVIVAAVPLLAYGLCRVAAKRSSLR